MDKYDHKDIEKKWREKWEQDDIYITKEDGEKYYVLDMFPYPSGAGLHVGHPKGYIATDILSRFKRMNGFSVLHPMGWDAFGLPAEQYALKNKVHPRDAVEENVATFKKQLEQIGLDYDWSREINTTDPAYYKWTQWIFIQMFKAGLAYESNEPINWCPSCLTGLANEDLEDGKCERCGSEIEKKPIRQWVLKITDYADRLLKDLEEVDWPQSIKELQRNWIGRSEGSRITFTIHGKNVDVFTTRADTLYGATYLVLAPEHSLVDELKGEISNFDDVEEYRRQASKKNEIERTAEGKEKTGVELKGIFATNPVNGENLTVYIADYVMADYGTGAIMAVPAHDERDWEFAQKYDIPVIKVIESDEECYTGLGILINSGDFNGLSSEEAKKKITEKVGGELTVSYKLRDWVFARQRYWGEPIPLIHCEKCGVVPVPEDELPVTLPEVEAYEPTGTGESPLAGIDEWVKTVCPQCGGAGKRETNTMPQWAGSSWYYLRYMDPHNDTELVSKEREAYWSPVDFYVGGQEHATRHLIYARFWHKFLYDLGVVSTSEPFEKLQHVGLIMAEDGRKMSKRYGNVINPDDVIETYGADTLRVYEMFMGPFDQSIAWCTDNMIGSRRFLEKIWRFKEKVTEKEDAKDITIKLHQTIKKVTEDIQTFDFNTAISAMMELANTLEKTEGISKDAYDAFLRILAPFAPHITEELWDGEGSIHTASWPAYNEAFLLSDTVTIPVQVNGKVRAEVEVIRDISEEDLKKTAQNLDKVKAWIGSENIVKIIVIPQRLVNIVTDR